MLPLAQPIQTPRLILRPFSPADFDDLYAYQSRPEVARYLRWHVRDRAQARAALEERRWRNSAGRPAWRLKATASAGTGSPVAATPATTLRRG